MCAPVFFLCASLRISLSALSGRISTARGLRMRTQRRTECAHTSSRRIDGCWRLEGCIPPSAARRARVALRSGDKSVQGDSRGGALGVEMA